MRIFYRNRRDLAKKRLLRYGRSLLTAPRTDPYVRHYRIRLVPWMVTTTPHVGDVLRLVRPTVRATWRPGAVSGPVATARRAPWSAPFPPPTPPTADRCRCSPISSVRWNCLTPRRRAGRTCGLAPSPTDPRPWKKWMSPGSLGFREKRVQPCLWSQTPWGSHRTRRCCST